MSKPMKFETPMFRLIEKQLCEALTADLNVDRLNPVDTLGMQARGVLAEILGYTHAHTQCTQPLWTYPCTNAPEGFSCTRGQGHSGPCAAEVPVAVHPDDTQSLREEIARLNAIINTPESDDFLKGVSREAEYQRHLHGVDATDARFDWHQWFWVSGYLLGKALAACRSGEGNGAKAKHHLVTTAALLMNWHNVLTGKDAASVHSNTGKPVADKL